MGRVIGISMRIPYTINVLSTPKHRMTGNSVKIYFTCELKFKLQPMSMCVHNILSSVCI